jgi:hypothetical protein
MGNDATAEISKVVTLETSVKNHEAGSINRLQDELHSIPKEIRDAVFNGVKQHDNGNTLISERKNGAGEVFLDMGADIYKAAPQGSADTKSGDGSTTPADLGKRWQKDFETGNLNDPTLRQDLITGAKNAYEQGGQAGVDAFAKQLNDNIPAAGAGVVFKADGDGKYTMEYMQGLKTEQNMDYNAQLTGPQTFSPVDQKTDAEARRIADLVKSGKTSDQTLQELSAMCETEFHKDKSAGAGLQDLDGLLNLINEKAGSQVVAYDQSGLTLQGVDHSATLPGVPKLR